MIICICKKLNEKEIKDQLAKHNGNLKQVILETGACTQCKKCAPDLAQIKDTFYCTPH